MADTWKHDDLQQLLVSEKYDHLPVRRSESLFHRHRKAFFAAITIFGFIVSSAFWSIGVVSAVRSLRMASNSVSVDPALPQILHCGETPEEARRLGCVFQIWSYSWVPAACHDPTLSDEFLALRDWEYYNGPMGQGSQMNLSDILTGNYDSYGTWGQHFYHCAFTWQNWAKIQTGSGIRPTNHGILYDHVVHCRDVVGIRADERPWYEVDTKLTLSNEIS